MSSPVHRPSQWFLRRDRKSVHGWLWDGRYAAGSEAQKRSPARKTCELHDYSSRLCMVRGDALKRSSQTNIWRTGHIRDPSRYHGRTPTGRKDDRTTHARFNGPYHSPLSGVWSVRLGGRKALEGAPIAPNYRFSTTPWPAKPQVVISGSTQRFEPPSNDPRRLMNDPAKKHSNPLIQPRCSQCGSSSVIPSVASLGQQHCHLEFRCYKAMWRRFWRSRGPNQGCRPSPTLLFRNMGSGTPRPFVPLLPSASEVTTGYHTTLDPPCRAQANVTCPQPVLSYLF